MKKLNKFIISSALVGCICISAVAQDKVSSNASSNAGKFYVGASAGVTSASSFKDQSFKITSKDPKSSPIFGVGLGYWANPNFRVAFDINYGSGMDISAYNTEVDGQDLSISKGKIRSLTGEINGYYHLLSGNVSPYMTAGFGIARTKLSKFKISQTAPGINPLGPLATITPPSGANQPKPIGYAVDYNQGLSKTNFSWNIGLGVTYKIDDTYLIDLGYKYRDLGKVSAKAKVDAYKFAYTDQNQPYTARLKSHNVMLGVVYNF